MSERDKREERRRYEGDVMYNVWRRGGNPDRINYDRVNDYFYDGISPESAARRELEQQQPKPEPEPESAFVPEGEP